TAADNVARAASREMTSVRRGLGGSLCGIISPGFDARRSRGAFMKRAVPASLLLLAACATAPQPSTVPEGPRGATRGDPLVWRVVTYNIHHGEGTDGRLDLERIAAVLRRLDPDVIALQEVDERVQRTGGVDQAATLGELLGMNHAFGGFMEYQGGNYGMAILTHCEIRRIEPVRRPDGNEPR